jgi:hypothetical protein
MLVSVVLGVTDVTAVTGRRGGHTRISEVRSRSLAFNPSQPRSQMNLPVVCAVRDVGTLDDVGAAGSVRAIPQL